MQLLHSCLDNLIEEHHLLKHPFYQAWSAGELSQTVLQTYAAQYYHQVKSFPRFISRVHTHCPDIHVRKALLDNLVDEERHGTDHPALWMQFAEGLGLTRESVENTVAIPETADMVDTYYALAEEDWRDGLCALYAYESQVPGISTSKIEGLEKFYGIHDEKSLAFFKAHEAYDVAHAKQVADLIDACCLDRPRAERATRRAAEVLWQFLDGMCHLGGIKCSNS
ncbi:MAG TPA: CADD family putative folate metabolism protein [Gammaproteobacteria bacterium]|nr:CADD family putative folate metabolism protein [Gammaproteobacteria bacterium]